jgi:hypothetical protein
MSAPASAAARLPDHCLGERDVVQPAPTPGGLGGLPKPLQQLTGVVQAALSQQYLDQRQVVGR